ncbi:mannose-6-phosphate isomerase 1 [Panicum miliaceum]|uniref:Mannose-6-phosphate isomerase 1 n=1 Tax=Panicum miliaceum TaxID=4540 RepID=A0A3L6PPG0_PANMI|nr:mannose-6-phosphate isomerase 1 [Panicum miliaceum]
MSLKEYDEGTEIKSSLQSAFAKLMATSKEKVSEALSKLIRRLNIESKVLKPNSGGLKPHLSLREKQQLQLCGLSHGHGASSEAGTPQRIHGHGEGNMTH